ncbi:MAG: archease [Nitrospirae bacterium]|nr:archease [Nitrospirota bacterium]
MYETFEHRADVGIRGYGKTMEEAFENGAKAMFSVMADIDEVKPIDREDVSCNAPDTDMLFVEWLNSLLSLSHLTGKLFCNFKVKIGDNRMTGSAWGERLDSERHHVMTEVKAATYSMLKVSREDDVYVAQCIVDV